MGAPIGIRQVTLRAYLQQSCSNNLQLEITDISTLRVPFRNSRLPLSPSCCVNSVRFALFPHTCRSTSPRSLGTCLPHTESLAWPSVVVSMDMEAVQINILICGCKLSIWVLLHTLLPLHSVTLLILLLWYPALLPLPLLPKLLLKPPSLFPLSSTA